MRVARLVEPSISPLDEELNLLPGSWTPLMHESMVRLGVWMPFRAAARELQFHRGMTVDDETVRKNTEQAGKHYLSEQERVPEPGSEPSIKPSERQAISADGSFVHLTNGDWVEAKMLTISNVKADGKCADVSYFARSAAYTDFSKQARGEVARRGVKNCAWVCSVADGAEWIQSVISEQRADAVRILDFYHAAERLAAIGHALFDPDKAAVESWFTRQRLELRDGDPDVVLSTLFDLSQTHPEHASLINGHLEYFTKRRPQMVSGAEIFE
jgi:hypothetical protein